MKRSFLRVALVLAVSLLSTTAFAEDVETVAEEKPVAGYDKGFFIQSPDGKFKMHTSGYVQGFLQGIKNEAAADTDTIRIRRARLKFKGHLYKKNYRYQIEYDFAGSTLLSTFVRLVHSDMLAFTVGNFKVPYNVEALVSASGQQFVDRSIAHGVFGTSGEREIGFGISGKLLEKHLEYMISIMNGEGNNTNNVNNEFRYAGRLMYHILGSKAGKTFSDIKGSDETQLALGAAVSFNDTPNAAATAEQKNTKTTVDLTAKCHGWGAHGAFFYKNVNPDGAAAVHDKGWLAQIGYMVVPETVELAARVAQTYLDTGSDLSEYTGGLNYYIHEGHRVKLQLDYSTLITENGVAAGNDRVNHRGRALLQIKL